MIKKLLCTVIAVIIVATFSSNLVIGKHVEEIHYTGIDRVYSVYNAVTAIADSEHVDTIMAMIAVESRGDTLAVSSTGDYGIMQVNKRVWKHKYDFNRMHEMAYGIHAGYSIYSVCYKMSNGNVRDALRLYNGSYKYADKVIGVMNVNRKSKRCNVIA